MGSQVSENPFLTLQCVIVGTQPLQFVRCHAVAILGQIRHAHTTKHLHQSSRRREACDVERGYGSFGLRRNVSSSRGTCFRACSTAKIATRLHMSAESARDLM